MQTVPPAVAGAAWPSFANAMLPGSMPAPGTSRKREKMFSHVMVGVADLEKSRRFYDALLATVGVAPGTANGNRYFWRSPGGTFGITTPINGEPACHGNGATIGFAMASPEQAERLSRSGHGQRRHHLRRPARFSRRLGRQGLPRLSARPGQQQDLRAAPAAQAGCLTAAHNGCERCGGRADPGGRLAFASLC